MGAGIFDKLKYMMGIDETEDDYDEEDAYEEQRRIEREDSRQPLQLVKDTKPVSFRGPQMKLVVHEPENSEEHKKIVDDLKNQKPVIINLEKLDEKVAKRIFDFVSGATYAMNGSVQKIANSIFVFAPENVDISSNAGVKEYENSQKASIFR